MPCQARCARATIFATLPRATTVVLALAFGLYECLTALAAPAAGKPPDSPFDERGGGEQRRPPKTKQQATKPPTRPSPARRAGRADDSEHRRRPGEERAPTKTRKTEGSLHALACLEGDTADGKRKGVQRRDFLKTPSFELAGAGRLLRVRRAVVHVQLRRRGRVLPVGGLRPRGAGDAHADQVPAGGAVQRRSTAEQHFTAERRLARRSRRCCGRRSTPSSSSPRRPSSTATSSRSRAPAGRSTRSVLGLTWEAGFGLKLYFSRFVTFRLERARLPDPAGGAGARPQHEQPHHPGGFSLWLG